MPISQVSYPIRFTPAGLVDAADATNVFPGACVTLKNLIFDRENPEYVVGRPGVVEITAFPGFITPDIISVQITVANVTYGLIASGLNVGKDQPFAYDHTAGAFIAITGITNANTPTTPAPSGQWTPPTMAGVGVYLIVTHPGFPGGATKFGYFDLTNPAAPVWNAGDTATSGLPSTPIAVANFGNRAYFACANSLAYTDVLSLTRTAGTQALTLGDTSPVTALAGLPVQTTSSGVVQALIAWKEFQCWQITGDAAASTLAQNYISLTTGCIAPRSIAQSPLGIYFAGFDGPYLIDPFGILRMVTNGAQSVAPDIQHPFQITPEPTRMAAGYSGGMYRICTDSTNVPSDASRDYWFDERRRRWTGPHGFPYDCLSQFGSSFVLTSNANPGKLLRSDVIPTLTTLYTDDGDNYFYEMQSSTFPKTGHMVVKQVVESTIEASANGNDPVYSLYVFDDSGTILDNVQIRPQTSGVLWGGAVWGNFNWNSGNIKARVYTVPWTKPLVFKKMALYIQGFSVTTKFLIGTFYARYQEAGYTNVP